MDAWIFLGGSVVLCVVFLVLDGWRRERSVMRDWDMALTPRGRDEVEKLAERLRPELGFLDLTYERAFRARATGDAAAAVVLLEAGAELVEEYAPTMLRALAAMAVLSRMVAAMAPVRPLRPAGFRLRQVANLAALEAFFHHLLATTGERFRLRTYILRRCFTALVRVARGAAQDYPRPRDFDAAAAVQHDAHALTDETLDSFRALVVSLAAEQRDVTPVL